MQPSVVRGLVCFSILLQLNCVAPQQDENDDDSNHEDDADHLFLTDEPAKPSAKAFPVSDHMMNASCEWPCLKCTKNGTQQTCISCSEGYYLTREGNCRATPVNHSGGQDVGTHRTRTRSAAISIMTIGFGVIALICAYCRDKSGNASSSHPSPEIDNLPHINVATSQPGNVSSNEEPADSVFVVVYHPDDESVVGVKKLQVHVAE